MVNLIPKFLRRPTVEDKMRAERLQLNESIYTDEKEIDRLQAQVKLCKKRLVYLNIKLKSYPSLVASFDMSIKRVTHHAEPADTEPNV